MSGKSRLPLIVRSNVSCRFFSRATAVVHGAMTGSSTRLGGRLFTIKNISAPTASTASVTLRHSVGVTEGTGRSDRVGMGSRYSLWPEANVNLNPTEMDPGKRIHLVAHSMGALVVREYLARNKPERLGRVVLLLMGNRPG